MSRVGGGAVVTLLHAMGSLGRSHVDRQQLSISGGLARRWGASCVLHPVLQLVARPFLDA